MAASVPFRFDAVEHAYIDLTTGEQRPHATGMMLADGIIDDTWFTEESSIRGTRVHTLTAQYDLKALDVVQTIDRYKPWVMAWVECIGLVPHGKMAVEVPRLHSVHRYGVRPDRTGTFYKREGVLELKTGQKDARAHGIQTALQAIAYEEECHVPATMQYRGVVYVRENGSYSLEEMTNLGDFVKAYELIKRYCY